MSGKYFLDTNIFVYCFDETDQSKRAKANSLVASALEEHAGIISSQVIQEFLNVATRKFSLPMSAGDAAFYLEAVLNPLCEVFAGIELFKEALRIHAETHFAFYDSLILAAASVAGCGCLYSEDMNHGQKVRGVLITNPFLPTHQRKLKS